MSIEYRQMKPEEAKETVRLARRVFPFWYRLFIHKFKDAVIAVENEKVVGGASYDTIKTGKGNFGYLSFGFTDKNYRGMGIGRITYTRAITQLKEADCEASGAIVLSDNTASWRLLADNGYRRSRAFELIPSYGFFGALKIWFESAFVLSPGAELWTSLKSEKKRSSSGLNIILFLIANFVLSILTSFRQGKGLDVNTAVFVSVLLLLRLVISRLIAGKSKFRLSFSFWRSGWMLSFFIILSGGLFPLGGDFYPSAQKWNYQSFRKQAGLLGLGSWLSVILAASLTLFVKYYIPDLMPIFYGVSQWIYMLLIFHAAPFLLESWPGNRVLHWNKALFAVLCFISFLILFLMFK